MLLASIPHGRCSSRSDRFSGARDGGSCAPGAATVRTVQIHQRWVVLREIGEVASAGAGVWSAASILVVSSDAKDRFNQPDVAAVIGRSCRKRKSLLLRAG